MNNYGFYPITDYRKESATLKVLAGKEDDHDNAKWFLEDILEEDSIDEKDRVRISYIKYDLDKYKNY